jgi:two-component system LytT family sensor kinase
MNSLETPITSGGPRVLKPQRTLMWLSALAFVILLFATQWYTYDVTREAASPYSYYLGWSCWIWGLAPLVFWLGGKYPIRGSNAKTAVAQHAGLSIGLSTLQVALEALFGWLRHGLSFEAALTHYFVQHSQLYLLTYWVLIGAAQFYRLQVESQERRLKTARLEAQLSEARLDLLRRQLQPHFLFNTLHTAIELVQEDPGAAENVLLSLSHLLRASLEENDANETSLRKELQFTDCYIDIQQHRFGSRLKVQQHIDPRALDLTVPSLVLQPLVENAILHGIGKHTGDDVVSIFASVDHDSLLLEVRNELSRLEEPIERLLKHGFGLANTRSRLRELYGERQDLKLSNLEPRGVGVKITMPIGAVTENDLNARTESGS